SMGTPGGAGAPGVSDASEKGSSGYTPPKLVGGDPLGLQSPKFDAPPPYVSQDLPSPRLDTKFDTLPPYTPEDLNPLPEQRLPDPARDTGPGQSSVPDSGAYPAGDGKQQPLQQQDQGQDRSYGSEKGQGQDQTYGSEKGQDQASSVTLNGGQTPIRTQSDAPSGLDAPAQDQAPSEDNASAQQVMTPPPVQTQTASGTPPQPQSQSAGQGQQGQGQAQAQTPTQGRGPAPQSNQPNQAGQVNQSAQPNQPVQANQPNDGISQPLVPTEGPQPSDVESVPTTEDFLHALTDAPTPLSTTAAPGETGETGAPGTPQTTQTAESAQTPQSAQPEEIGQPRPVTVSSEPTPDQSTESETQSETPAEPDTEPDTDARPESPFAEDTPLTRAEQEQTLHDNAEALFQEIADEFQQDSTLRNLLFDDDVTSFVRDQIPSIMRDVLNDTAGDPDLGRQDVLDRFRDETRAHFATRESVVQGHEQARRDFDQEWTPRPKPDRRTVYELVETLGDTTPPPVTQGQQDASPVNAVTRLFDAGGNKLFQSPQDLVDQVHANRDRSDVTRDFYDNCVIAALTLHTAFQAPDRSTAVRDLGKLTEVKEGRTHATVAQQALDRAAVPVGAGPDALTKLAELVRESGDKTSAMVFISRTPGDPDGKGHAFNLVNDNGVLTWVDLANNATSDE
ncbi:toxin glutamine deamidase domain-containing protein, partial [Streptomyces sp. NPDC048290]|uniref:toxin glutamine deamidase domain-containing protein n=1 Tax=Streptomyces sp. NPDC048290 TaxID=3155811 RepID=UPI003446C588